MAAPLLLHCRCELHATTRLGQDLSSARSGGPLEQALLGAVEAPKVVAPDRGVDPRLLAGPQPDEPAVLRVAEHRLRVTEPDVRVACSVRDQRGGLESLACRAPAREA